MTSERERLDAARAHHMAGRIGDAEPVYREVIAANPENHEAWHLLGVLELQRGNLDAAIGHLTEACRLGPAVAKYFNNLGNALGQAGQLPGAENAYRQAQEIDPGFLDPLYNLGVINHQAQRVVEAEQYYREVLALEPTHPNANNNLGALAKDKGQAKEAEAYFTKALEGDPEDMEARANLGILAEERGDVAEAAAAFDQVLARTPSDAIRLKRALLMPALYHSVEQITSARAGFEAQLDALSETPLRLTEPVRECSRATFFLAYHGLNDRPFQEKVAALYRKTAPALYFTAPHIGRGGRSGDKIKLGFLSKYFRNHTIGKLNRGLIAHLPKDEFEITLFPVMAGDDDDIARFFQAHADQVIPLAPRLEESMKRVAAAELDLLYFTDIGMDPYPYFMAFGRLAPVQCVSWGHPVTTGIDTVDYFVSAAGIEADGADDHYSERLVRLDHVPTYYYRPDDLPPGGREEFGFTDSDNLYVCAQSLFKLHPDMDAAFAGILDADPKARIVLIGGNDDWQKILTRRFDAAAGGNAARITFLPRMSPEKFTRLLGVADVLLDSFPFSGGNTSLEGFALGQPIVTLPPAVMRGRVTLGMYRQMEIEAGVAADVADYVAKAVRLATDEDYRRHVSGLIRDRNHVLFENPDVIDDFASFFRDAVEAVR